MPLAQCRARYVTGPCRQWNSDNPGEVSNPIWREALASSGRADGRPVLLSPSGKIATARNIRVGYEYYGLVWLRDTIYEYVLGYIRLTGKLICTLKSIQTYTDANRHRNTYNHTHIDQHLQIRLLNAGA